MDLEPTDLRSHSRLALGLPATAHDSKLIPGATPLPTLKPARMNAMRFATRRILASIGLAISYGSVAHAQAAVAEDARRLLSTLYTAISHGDSTSARSLVANDLIWVIGNSGAIITKSQLLAAASAPSPVRFEIDSLRAQ